MDVFTTTTPKNGTDPGLGGQLALAPKNAQDILMDLESQEKVLIYLKGISVYGGRAGITDQTEIYYDLQLFGDDLCQFAKWLEKKFGVPADFDPSVYGPAEGLMSAMFRRWRWRWDRASRHYKSLRVADIFGIIDAGHWPDQAA